MEMQNKIFLKIASTVFVEYFNNLSKVNNNIIFYPGDCSSYKTIRFYTSLLDEIFPLINDKIGFINNGRIAYYQFYNIDNEWKLSLDIYNKSNDILSSKLEYLKANFKDSVEHTDYTCIKTWNLGVINSDVNKVIDTLDNLFNNDFINFENELRELMIHFNESKNEEEYYEGNILDDDSTYYERNKKARQKCLDYYGYTCQICGFSFKEKYGEDFKNVIEVHHIVPISEIGKEYKVDPIKDLIPVCPNCHRALHSKKDGVYTPEELRKFIRESK